MGHARLSFGADMLRARAAGRKTETRRTIKPSNVRALIYSPDQVAEDGGFAGAPMKVGQERAFKIWEAGFGGHGGAVFDKETGHMVRACRDAELGLVMAHVKPLHQSLDRLTWKEDTHAKILADGHGLRAEVRYVADDTRVTVEVTEEQAAQVVQRGDGKLVARYMPQWRARFVDTIIETRFERLLAIDDDGARAEGYDDSYTPLLSPRGWFRQKWCEIHGPEAWAANPIVLVYVLAEENPW